MAELGLRSSLKMIFGPLLPLILRAPRCLFNVQDRETGGDAMQADGANILHFKRAFLRVYTASIAFHSVQNKRNVRFWSVLGTLGRG